MLVVVSGTQAPVFCLEAVGLRAENSVVACPVNHWQLIQSFPLSPAWWLSPKNKQAVLWLLTPLTLVFAFKKDHLAFAVEFVF